MNAPARAVTVRYLVCALPVLAVRHPKTCELLRLAFTLAFNDPLQCWVVELSWNAAKWCSSSGLHDITLASASRGTQCVARAAMHSLL